MPPTRFTLQDIVQRLGGEIDGDASLAVTGVATIEEAVAGQITFLANSRYRSRLASTRASAVIVGRRDRDAAQIARIVCDNPYAYYARTVSLFHPPRAAVPGVHPGAMVDATATIAASAEIGAGAVIGPGAQVGERARIGAGCVVGEGASIGEDSLLHARVTVYADCVVGRRCILHSGAVIGADGFGMAPEAGRWVKIAQVGRAVLGDDVEVGANTAIDRGALGDTLVEEGVKIDNLVQIGHNCRIGAHTAIAGCAGVAGSVRIGRHCLIGGGSRIVGHVTICDGVTVSATTLVTKSIGQPGTFTSALPMMPHARWLRNAAEFRRLDETARLARARAAPGDDHADDDH